MELLVEGEVAGELVAPVRYLYDRFGLGLELLGVYLDHPDLVRSLVGQLPDGRVLREETVPVGPPVASPHRTEDGRDGRRGEYGVGGDPVSPAIEGPELAGEHVHGPDEQDGVGVLRLYLYLSEIHPPLEHPLELLKRRYGEIVVVGAYRRHRDVVLQVARPQDPRVDDLLVGCGGGVVPPEGVQRLRGPCPAPPEVPLRPTTSYRFNCSARRSLLSTPAVKAVWLPPPWHAMATRLVSPRPSNTHLHLRRPRRTP